MRAVWFTLGWVCVGLGMVGLTLPLLPTTVFLLAAAFFFARSSPALHDWLLAHRWLGPPIADWRAHRAIRPAAKRAAGISLALSLAATLAIGAPLWLVAAQAAALLGVAAFIFTRPDGPA